MSSILAQSSKFNLPVEVHHFIPNCTKQMIQHALFSKKMGAKLKLHHGNYFSSLLQSGLHYSLQILTNGPNSYRMPVGGSDPIGTLGPLNAFLEMVEQAQNREIPLPDFIIVGVGTCGTMAGLLAAQKIAGVSTRIIGIRCVDKIVCNPFRISHLANQTLKYLNLSARLASSDVDLRDHGKIRYGNPNSDANDLIQLLQNTEKINLDTTYTTKVVSGMKELLKSESMKNKNILYWHTYSPSAMNEKFDPALLMTPTSGRITLPSR